MCQDWLFFLRGPIAWLFDAQGVTLTLVYLFCEPLTPAFFFDGAIFVGNAAFNNLGQPFFSIWINWGRRTLGAIPFVLVGSALFDASGVPIGRALGGRAGLCRHRTGPCTPGDGR